MVMVKNPIHESNGGYYHWIDDKYDNQKSKMQKRMSQAKMKGWKVQLMASIGISATANWRRDEPESRTAPDPL